MKIRTSLSLVWLLLGAARLIAVEAAPTARLIPPQGIAISAGDRKELEAGAQALAKEIEALREGLKPALLELLPDVEIFHKAVDWAARDGEFYRSNEVDVARGLLSQGMERAARLRAGDAPWAGATGLVVRGYVSRIDGSVQFRADAPVKPDQEIGEAEIASCNLVLWGDPKSNKLLAKIADKLPVAWDATTVRVAEKNFGSSDHVPMLIYPNPLNPSRYVVLNSGFTFAHPRSTSNADQTPKLPDYAVIDIDGPPSVGVAGEVVEAGFFDEQWKLSSMGKWAQAWQSPDRINRNEARGPLLAKAK